MLHWRSQAPERCGVYVAWSRGSIPRALDVSTLGIGLWVVGLWDRCPGLVSETKDAQWRR